VQYAISQDSNWRKQAIAAQNPVPGILSVMGFIAIEAIAGDLDYFRLATTWE
jgi:hypothetical protein